MNHEDWWQKFYGLVCAQNPGAEEVDMAISMLAEAPIEFLNESVPNGGSTALYFASAHAHLDVIRAMLTRGADPRILGEHGRSPLYAAAVQRRADATRLLLDAGADPNDGEPGDVSVLMQAASKATPEVVRMLLEAGADPLYVSAAGEDAVSDAQAAAYRLGEHGAAARETLALLRAAVEAAPTAPPRTLAGDQRGSFTLASRFANAHGDSDLRWALLFCRSPSACVASRLGEVFECAEVRLDAGGASIDRKTDVFAFVLEVPDTDWTMVVLDIAEPRVARAPRLAQAKDLSTIGRTVAFLTCTADVFDDGKLVAEHRWDFGEHGPPRTEADPDGSKHDAKMFTAMDAYFAAEKIRFPNVELRVLRGGYQQLRAYGPVSKLHLVVKGAKSTKKSASAKAPSKNTSSKTAAASKAAKAKPTKSDSTKKR